MAQDVITVRQFSSFPEKVQFNAILASISGGASNDDPKGAAALIMLCTNDRFKKHKATDNALIPLNYCMGVVDTVLAAQRK
jgi:hypothetical protein